MKVHYINILLFAVSLNILLLTSQVHNQRNHKNTTLHTPTTRLLCECELYVPANYDNDLEMKEVMDNFNKQTQQRFHEYNDRIQSKRMQCKEQCEKEIQKIILKDKLEKELMDKFATLQTDIQSDAIPTCICEKSLPDKVEKECLRCGGVFGGGVMPGFGAIGGSALYALNVWKPAALKAAITAAKQAAATRIATAANASGKIAGEAKGVEIVNMFLKVLGVEEFIPGISDSIGNGIHYTNAGKIADTIWGKYSTTCMGLDNSGSAACDTFNIKFRLFITKGKPDGPPPAQAIPERVADAVDKATKTAKAVTEAEVVKVTAAENAAIEAAQEKAMEATIYNWYTTIGYSILAILIIVLVMIIIYLVLRYRRKKKMKKKLQYIKLLEE
ncbi:rifin PIR protein, putative [Plasmodium reichenowi]|uniref:Rifin PIR protein, putative n=1 Tax=Plasmodium reichenowi TaxID=5854 RepID=A0A2P9DCD5_PLARE|nr:rifin PIR protein, putative [Plasmodium reichenowi]